MGKKKNTKYHKEYDVLPVLMSLLLWNVGGPSAGKGTASKRKRAIIRLLKSKSPSIVLLQEFLWRKIENHRTWKVADITDRYEYVGHKEAGILYDTDELEVNNLTTDTKIRRILEELLRKKKLSPGFTPLARMCIAEIKSKGVSTTDFLCVSLHGSHNSRKKEDLVEEFKNLLVFMKEIGQQYNLPLIIGGDFNLRYEDTHKDLEKPRSGLTAYMYDPLERRRSRLIDFYIGSSTLPLAKITAVDLKKETIGEDAQKIFDHDPVEATLITHA